MPKWRPDCRSLKNEAGITLVELLAVLALMSVVIILGGSIHMFGQNQFQAQTQSASENNDLSYAMTMMSRDLRKIPLAEVDEKITLNSDSNLIEITDGPTYSYHTNKLLRNNEVIVENLNTKPSVKFNDDGNKSRIEISFKQKNSQAGVVDKDYQTTIYFRGEPNND